MRKQVFRYAVVAAALLVLSRVAGAQEETPVTLALGGEIILRVRQTVGVMTPQARVDAITDRLARVIEFPDITPDDVIVYAPPGKAPAVYAVGRRLFTVDAAMVQAIESTPAASSLSETAAMNVTERNLAIHWARQLQQILPLVDYRKPNEAEPVVPLNPPLKVTSDLSKVRGESGEIRLHDTLIGYFDGPQSGGMTAAERADIVSSRLDQLASKIDTCHPDLVSLVMRPDKTVQVDLGDVPVLTADANAALMAGAGSPWRLAQIWVKNLRTALHLTDSALTPTPYPKSSPGESFPAGPSDGGHK